MKRLLLIVAGCLLGLSLSAQSGRYVYWFDDNYDAHITDSLSATSQLQIGASHLTAGFHTLYMLLGSDSALRMESSTFFITPPLLPPDTFDQHYTYWLDQDMTQTYEGTLTGGQMLIDCNSLDYGFHSLHILLGSGTTSRPESHIFYKTPPTRPADTFDQHYTYWLDQDMTQTYEGTLAGGQMLINCNSLDYGFHSLHILLGSGTTARLENHIFYKTPPTRPADTFDQHYTYWFDQDLAQTYEGTLAGGQMLINCDSLNEGFHILNMRLGSGTTARLEHHTFFIPPKALAENYTDLAYWYEGEGVMHHVSPIGGMHLLDVPQMDCGAQGKIFLMASDSLGNTSPVMAHEFVMMDSNCCLAPLFATADHVTDSGARLHWDYNRPQTYTLVYDTVPINDPTIGHNRVTLTDTLYWFTNMPAGIICYYAIKSDCGDRWTFGEWNTRCRALTPLYAEACDSYTWKGTVYTSRATVPEFVFTTTGGCDSVTVMHINIKHSTSSTETVTACDSYTWHGTAYTASTSSPTFTQPNAAGCDSVTTLHLTISQSAITNEYVTACDSYTWQGTTYSASTTDSLATANAYGCDSIAILHLTINNSNTGVETVTACDSYAWHGTAYTASTSSPTFTQLNAAGCDSVTTLHLTINNSTTGVETVTACDSYTWHGTAYTASTSSPTFTQLNAAGCDSVVTLHLTINNSTTGVETVTACDSYTWHGTSYTASTSSPTFTQLNATGCDSVVTLHLTINNSTTGVETVTACDSYTWHGTTYTASTSSPTFTSTNAAGCDSVTTLHLTVNLSTTGVETVTACDSYTWHGTTYTASTSSPTFTQLNAAGCDSVTTLHLTVNLSTTGVETVTACDSYTWHGTSYTASTSSPTFTQLNAAGCDSVITLNLTINYSTSSTENVTACDSYTWNGTSYTASAVDSVSTLNAAGCDSVVTLNLTINYSTTGVETVTACDSYTWNGTTYTASAVDSVSTLNAAGCDSTAFLHLTINYSTYDTIHERAVNSFEWNGTVLTETGEYTYEGQTVAGCDSIVILKLTIDHVGISDVEGFEDIIIYPNPTTGKLSINADGVTKVEVFDHAGRLVNTFVNTNQLDISQLPTGTYALRITLQKGSTVRRVIKR